LADGKADGRAAASGRRGRAVVRRIVRVCEDYPSLGLDLLSVVCSGYRDMLNLEGEQEAVDKRVIDCCFSARNCLRHSCRQFDPALLHLDTSSMQTTSCPSTRLAQGSYIHNRLEKNLAPAQYR
jgi:hypothetical protein